jgi:transposase
VNEAKDMITMSKKELRRYEVVKRVVDKTCTGVSASEQLDVSDRQVRRWVARVKLKGMKGLIHGGRGKVSHKKIRQKERDRIMAIVREQYADFGPTLLSEKLSERHGIRMGREKLRQWMVTDGVSAGGRWRRKKQSVHAWRERKACTGEMVQMDGSIHDWLEGRGPKMTIMAYIDDATSQVHGRFYGYEGTLPAIGSLMEYVRKHGIPESIYLDRHSTYRTTRNTDGLYEDTQFKRVVQELGIKMIYAHSPQAKGRIERLFKTLQDRLVKEMRLEGVTTMADANQILKKYLSLHNRKFSQPAQSPINRHKAVPEWMNVEKICRTQEARVVTNGYTVHYSGKVYAIRNPVYAMKGKTVAVCEYPDSKTMDIVLSGKPLSYKDVTYDYVINGKENKKISKAGDPPPLTYNINHDYSHRTFLHG